MKIIITQTFEKNFDKEFRLYHLAIKDIVQALKKHPLVTLSHPYQKIKCYIKGVPIRGLVMIEQGCMIPIFVVSKNNNQRGGNLVLDNEVIKKINLLQSQYNKDIQYNHYEIY